MRLPSWRLTRASLLSFAALVLICIVGTLHRLPEYQQWLETERYFEFLANHGDRLVGPNNEYSYHRTLPRGRHSTWRGTNATPAGRRRTEGAAAASDAARARLRRHYLSLLDRRRRQRRRRLTEAAPAASSGGRYAYVSLLANCSTVDHNYRQYMAGVMVFAETMRKRFQSNTDIVALVSLHDESQKGLPPDDVLKLTSLGVKIKYISAKQWDKLLSIKNVAHSWAAIKSVMYLKIYAWSMTDYDKVRILQGPVADSRPASGGVIQRGIHEGGCFWY